MYYAVIGTIICVIIGIIIGLITGSEKDAFDERLLHPLVAKLCRRLPGAKRTYTNPDRPAVTVEKDVEKESSEKTDETVAEEPSETKQTVFTTTGSRLFDVYDVRRSPTPSLIRTRL